MPNDDGEVAGRYTVRSVARALRLVGAVAEGPPEGRSLSDLARELGTSKSTTLALARTLSAFGYLRDATHGRGYALGTALNTYGAATNYVTNQVNYNSDKITALNDGLGSLVDANLAQESALLQSLQIKQQLGTQALSIANQSPQVILSLFK